MKNNLEHKIGYVFNNTKLLQQALTHSSISADIHRNYERLEFLGDRILGVTVADMLCEAFPDEEEGSLAQRFVALVCKETVAEVVRGLDVPSYIVAANEDVCQRENVLCDVGEALIAAIYLDSGNIETARDFVRRFWLPHIDRRTSPRKDFKSVLQEKAAELKLPAPVYRMLKKSGPDHQPVFSIEVTLGEKVSVGQGCTKKHAQQAAAAEMLEQLGFKYA